MKRDLDGCRGRRAFGASAGEGLERLKLVFEGADWTRRRGLEGKCRGDDGSIVDMVGGGRVACGGDIDVDDG